MVNRSEKVMSVCTGSKERESSFNREQIMLFLALLNYSTSIITFFRG